MELITKGKTIDLLIHNDVMTVSEDYSYLESILYLGFKGYCQYTVTELKDELYERFEQLYTVTE